jgi:hypothetical protein
MGEALESHCSTEQRMEARRPLIVGLVQETFLTARLAFGLRLKVRTAFFRKRITKEATRETVPSSTKVLGSETGLPIYMTLREAF